MSHPTEPTPPADPVGVIGLGLVGLALARRLLAAGFIVHGFDLRTEALAPLRAAGGQAAASAAEIGAACGTVVLAVFDTDDVLSLAHAPDGLLAPGHRVRSLIDCSTGDPAALSALSEQLAARGLALIEAPLSGSSQQIAAGEATQLLGGESAAIELCDDILQALSPQRLHVGPAGSAARAKLATNLVLGLNRAALAEGMAFAESQGIDRASFLALVLATPARSAAAEIKGPLMVSGRYEPQSRIRQHHKDVTLMLQAARAAGQALPLSETHLRLMQQAIDAGDGDLDNAGLLRQWLRMRP